MGRVTCDMEDEIRRLRAKLAAAEKVCQAVGRAKECRIGSPKYEPCSGCSNTIYAAHDEWMEVVQKGGS